MTEPPYGIICNLLKKGEVIPFLGAGASLSGRQSGATWEEKSASFLPMGKELAALLAEEATFPSADPHDREDLAKVASYYLEQADRPSLLARLHEIFNRTYQVGAVHRFLADVPVPLLIVTTNYDDLIEQAFKEKGKPYHLVVHPTESKELAGSVLWWKPGASEPAPYPPAKLPLSVTDTSVIYKMHGSVDRQAGRWDSFVITEEDYVDFLSRMTGQTAIPARFMLHFRTRHFLFLGYGLADWNLRVVLRNLKTAVIRPEIETAGNQSERPFPEEALRSWAIQYKPSELERMLWQARKVNIFNMGIDDFIAKLCERMT
ncbi:MAG: hypothetical protein DYG89_02415 [Caldilinea sp. CFX5]|nr:hypothetical protein [Caldilinea sp. CFX5]